MIPAPAPAPAVTVMDAAPPPPCNEPSPPQPETAPAEPPEAAETSPASVEPAPAVVLHLAPVPRVAPPPAKARRARPQDGDDEPEPNWAAEADFYAKIYPDRARLFRKLGRLPDPCDFGPPEPKLLRAIITGTTPALLALDIPNPAAEQRLRRYA